MTYFKRYRMEVRLDGYRGFVTAPAGFQLLSWSSRLLDQHAEVKWESFRQEIDSHVFPCLGQLDGCRQLMRDIAGRQDFVPAATWLVSRDSQ
ncbi:MAG TPA: GNAT family N-acetyltransferase, partial [Planctomycetaceae bacterium]|nr:GNAT family N-acetyltransferase [Planctomycetaceae bacterium]